MKYGDTFHPSTISLPTGQAGQAMLNKSDVEIFKEVSMGGRFGKYGDARAHLAVVMDMLKGY